MTGRCLIFAKTSGEILPRKALLGGGGGITAAGELLDEAEGSIGEGLGLQLTKPAANSAIAGPLPWRIALKTSFSTRFLLLLNNCFLD